MTEHTAILGHGAWGRALHSVYPFATLYGRGTDIVRAETVFVAIPSHAVLSVLPRIQNDAHIILCAKGFDPQTGALFSEQISRTRTDTRISILTGPNFAHEIVAGLPAAATLAGSDPGAAERYSTRLFRLYWTDDIAAAQVAGAMKNIIAIACGIVDGLALGENARAALITRGLAEMARVVTAYGGRKETLLGLCGVGDLLLTCTSARSRNFRMGQRLAAGDYTITETTEGVAAARVLSQKKLADIPVTRAVADCVDGKISAQGALEQLLARPFRTDREGE